MLINQLFTLSVTRPDPKFHQVTGFTLPRRELFDFHGAPCDARCTVALAGARAYRFLPPFFFAPLAAFFAIVVIPPFTRGILPARGCPLHCSAAAIRRAGLLLSAPRRFFAITSASRKVCTKK